MEIREHTSTANLETATKSVDEDGIEIIAAPVRPISRFLPFTRARNALHSKKRLSDYVVEVTTTENYGGQLEGAPGGHPPIRLLSFFLIVMLPFLGCLSYFVFLASNQYTAEAHFAVRSLADQGKTDGVDSGVIGLDVAPQDAFVITSFIHSPELLARLGKVIDYRAMFARDGIDFLSSSDPAFSVEAFLDYWKKQVTAYIDGPSGIITLRARTFRPEDSKALVEAILVESENLINELNRRAQQDMVAGIRSEVEKAGKAYGESLYSLNQFQTQAGLLSPEVQAKETGKLLTTLLAQKLELETRLFVLKQSSAEASPAYEQLVRTQSSVDAQVSRLQSQLTGPENASMAAHLLNFSKLETERLVSEKLYEAARTTYNAALAASLRKALYVMIFVHPSLPEEALFPNRVSTPLIIGLGLLVLWGTLMLLWASVEDHRL
ncbi:capsule biosynthesis protein [Rhizobium deserti]|uniref:Capsule biosynthesis protein n=1 Tax=Rhizobium deserti TaxID=2547961 RepID=A0A4R5UN03_9HYPH|nr:capsule biosynthesis protein [Rhizobium deserti]TDK39138.1 capsule biosynthesis protein [Rhizobium deserti]